MIRSRLIGLLAGLVVMAGSMAPLTASASIIDLSAPEWLGGMSLEDNQLGAIKQAIEKALSAPIDAEQQCGEVRLDCVVRTVREWTFDGNKYREIVIHLHMQGQASKTIGQVKGKWPAITVAGKAPTKTADKKE